MGVRAVRPRFFSHNLPQERIKIYNMEVNGKTGFELSSFELSMVFQEPNPYLTQGIPVLEIIEIFSRFPRFILNINAIQVQIKNKQTTTERHLLTKLCSASLLSSMVYT